MSSFSCSIGVQARLAAARSRPARVPASGGGPRGTRAPADGTLFAVLPVMMQSTTHAMARLSTWVGASCLFVVTAFAPASAGTTALVSAYDGEFEHLRRELEGFSLERIDTLNGVHFLIGTAHGRPVVLFECGIGLVNAAMTLQLALDRFDIDRVLFSGTAGGIDPSLEKGDITIAAQWHYTEYGARFTPDPDHPSGYRIPEFMRLRIGDAHLGNFFPYPKSVRNADHPTPVRKRHFETDQALLDLARRTAERVELENVTGAPARILVGTVGGSGFAYNDDLKIREFVAATWGTAAVDMESAALAHVGYANGVPVMSVRAVSDIVANEDPQEFETYRPIAERNAARFVNAMLELEAAIEPADAVAPSRPASSERAEAGGVLSVPAARHAALGADRHAASASAAGSAPDRWRTRTLSSTVTPRIDDLDEAAIR